MLKNERYNSIDVLKCLCAFMVICIHAPFPGKIGEYLVAISRIAVPIFFMISGFFWENTCSKKGEIRTIKKLFYLTIGTNIFYLIINLIFRYDIQYLINFFSFKNIVKMLIFNYSIFSEHLWYLSAILYVTVVVYVLDKLKIRNKVCLLIPVLIVIDLIFGKYSILLFHREFPYILLRNFLFVGLPFFLIGTLLFKYRDNIKNSFSATKIIFLIVIFIFLNCIERYVLEINLLNAVRDQYICTTILSVLFFMLAIVTSNKVDDNLMSLIGRKYSTMIYIIHPFWISVVSKIISLYFSNVRGLISYLFPFAVFGISIIFSYIYYFFVNKYKR